MVDREEDRARDALAAWREATEHAEPEPREVPDILRAIEREAVASALWSIGRGALAVTAFAAGVLVLVAFGSARQLAHEMAEQALAREAS